MPAKIRLVLVDDQPLIREAVRARLEATGHIEVVGEGASGEEALAQAGAHHPDIVLLDIAMPGMDGLRASRLLREHFPLVKVVVLTAHHNREYRRQCALLGVWGYVLKNTASAELVRVLEAAHQGRRSLSPD